MDLKFRTERIEEHPAVYDVIMAAFEQETESKLANALRKNEKAFVEDLSIVAELKGEIIGYLLFTKIFIINEKGVRFNSLCLAPMGILPEFQKQGIGTQFIRYGLAKAKMLGFESVVVLGHADFYGKFGFVPCYKWSIKAPFEVPEESLRALELVKNGLQGVHGMITYPKEFDSLS